MSAPKADDATPPVAPQRKRTPRGQGRAKLVAVATDLFVERGVSGTSLQAIADRLGITKAAVYHQFATKEQIVLAAAAAIIDQLGDIADTADSIDDRADAVASVIGGLTALVVRERGIAGTFRTDPAMLQVLGAHEPYTRAIERIDRILLGPTPSEQRRIAFAFAGSGIMSIGSDRSLDAVPPEVLRTTLAAAMTRALDTD